MWKDEKIHTCSNITAVDHMKRYLTREQDPLKGQFLPEITAATRRGIYYKAQKGRLMYSEFVLQLCHTYKVDRDGFLLPCCSATLHMSYIVFATSAVVGNLNPRYVQNMEAVQEYL